MASTWWPPATAGCTRIGPVDVVVSSVVAGLAGVVVLRLPQRWTTTALAIWTTGAVLMLILSMPSALSALNPAAQGTLVALHAVVAGVVIVAGHRSRSRGSAFLGAPSEQDDG